MNIKTLEKPPVTENVTGNVTTAILHQYAEKLNIYTSDVLSGANRVDALLMQHGVMFSQVSLTLRELYAILLGYEPYIYKSQLPPDAWFEIAFEYVPRFYQGTCTVDVWYDGEITVKVDLPYGFRTYFCSINTRTLMEFLQAKKAAKLHELELPFRVYFRPILPLWLVEPSEFETLEEYISQFQFSE